MKREKHKHHNSQSPEKKVSIRPRTMLDYWRIVTACIWVFCTLLLLLPKPWILFWNHNLKDELGIGYEHLMMFVVLGFFVELSQRKAGPFIWLNILCLYGLATEFIQTYIPPRACDMIDFCQDCTGAYIGVTIGCIVKILLNIRDQK